MVSYLIDCVCYSGIKKNVDTVKLQQDIARIETCMEEGIEYENAMRLFQYRITNKM